MEVPSPDPIHGDHVVEKRLKGSDNLGRLGIIREVVRHPVAEANVNLPRHLGEQRQLSEVAGGQRDCPRGVDRHQERSAPRIALQPVVRGRRQRDLQELVLRDRAVVEGGSIRRADHAFGSREAALSAGLADRQLVTLNDVLIEYLPVGVPDIRALRGTPRCSAPCRGRRSSPPIRRGAGHGGSLGVERHEHPAQPLLASGSRENAVCSPEGLVEAHRRGHARSAV